MTPVASPHRSSIRITPPRTGLPSLAVLVLSALSGRLGGQAVLEGVMMRGPERLTVAVRRPDNRIGVMMQSSRSRSGRGLARIPIIRGIIVTWEGLRLGVRALTESAKVVSGEDESPTRGSISRAGMGVTVIVALAVAVALFFLTPLLVTRQVLDLQPGTTFWLVEGGVRILVLVLYLLGLGLIPDMRRMMQYHAAEHMVIHAYEAGQPIDAQTAATHPRHHPRCGTALLLVIMIVAIIVFAAVGDRAAWVLVASRVAGLPLIAGVAYEIMRFIASAQDSVIGRALAAPGNLLQRLTTRTPTHEHLEVASVALRRLLGVDPSITDSASKAEVLA